MRISRRRVGETRIVELGARETLVVLKRREQA
jgi:hypothetical protein